MAGEIFLLTLCMLVVAALSFAPFAYFIYAYIVIDNENGPFHEEAGKSHQPGLEDKVLGLAELLVNKVKGAAKK